MPQRLTQLAKTFLILEKPKHNQCKRKNLWSKRSGLLTPGFLLEKTQRERFLISSKKFFKKEKFCSAAGWLQGQGAVRCLFLLFLHLVLAGVRNSGANSNINSVKVFLGLLSSVVFDPYFFRLWTAFCQFAVSFFSGYVRIADLCLSLFSLLHVFVTPINCNSLFFLPGE